VSEDQVSRAVALRGSGGELADLIGGPLGGVLVAAAGFAVAATVDAVTYAPVLIVLFSLRGIRAVIAGPRQSLWSEARAGVTTVAQEPLIRSSFALVAVSAGVFVPVGSVLVPLLVRSRDWTAASGGLLLGGLSLGAIAVTLVIARTGTAHRSGPVAALGLLTAGLALTMLGLAGGHPLSLVAAVLAGGGVALFTAHTFPLILLATPDAFLSRVQSLLGLTQAATLIVTAPLLGVAASTFGPATTLVGSGVLLSAAAVVAVGNPSWRRGTVRESPS
jgi:Transmembrane secretion effector